MKERWKLIAVIAAATVFLGAGVGLAVTLWSKPAPVKKIETKPVRKKSVVKKQADVCPLDGRDRSSGVVRPLAVMVENMISIRPQAGPGQACLVVEGLSEGGITRFMLVFGAHESENVGPIRSARIHFVSLAKGWDALFGHVGGSKYALSAIREWGVFDWDQSAHGSDYTRVSSAWAPHNVFTSTKRLRDAAEPKETRTEALEPLFKFKDAPAFEARPEGFKSVIIDFSDPAYRVEYQYDRQTNTYKRFNGGLEHTDANTKEQIAPTNIIVLRTAHNDIPGGSGVLDVNMTGTGQATVFRDGTVVEGNWERADLESPILFNDSAGNEIELTAGQTWIEITNLTTPVDIQQ